MFVTKMLPGVPSIGAYSMDAQGISKSVLAGAFMRSSTQILRDCVKMLDR